MKTNNLNEELTSLSEPTCALCKKYLGSTAPTYTCALLKLYVEPDDEVCAMYKPKDILEQRMYE